MRFVPSLVEAYKAFKPGQADIVFISSDRSADLQRRYMEEGVHVEDTLVAVGSFLLYLQKSRVVMRFLRERVSVVANNQNRNTGLRFCMRSVVG